MAAWFERHKINPLFLGYGSHTHQAEHHGVDPSRVRSALYGDIGPERANVSLLFHGEIWIDFFFDGQGRLLDWRVEGWSYF